MTTIPITQPMMAWTLNEDQKKSIYLEGYSGRLITSMRSAFFYFLFVTTISSERKKKRIKHDFCLRELSIRTK